MFAPIAIIFSIAGIALLILIPMHAFRIGNKSTDAYKAIKFLGEIFLLIVLPVIGFYNSKQSCDDHPFELNSYPSAIALYLLPLICYFISSYFKQKLSPGLLAVLPMGLVIGIIYTAVLMLHFGKHMGMVIFPVIGLSLAAPIVAFLYLIIEFFALHKYQTEVIKEKQFNSQVMQTISHLFLLPFWQKIPLAILLCSPILAAMQFALTLIGQAPDSLISMFTESCGFVLSKYQDCSCGGDHYLCSVAANGNKKMVKPLRYGVRKNERILVNRQLLVANAFENWMEEHVPKLHRFIRNTYDSMNIPVNKWSKDKKKANIIYILMKPIEWLFLIWLYCFDTKPESRIAIQYLPKHDFEIFKKQQHEIK